MTALTLTEFLLARIAEDESNIDGDWAAGDGGLHIISTPMRDRLLAECEAKRRIVERATDRKSPERDTRVEAAFDEAEFICRILAAVYADHPDYREAWRA